MTLRLHVVFKGLAAVAVVAAVALISSPSADYASLRGAKGAHDRDALDRSGRGPQLVERNGREPVGRERVVIPPMPGPVDAGNGAVYVPRALAQIPFFQEPGTVVDDPASELGDNGTVATSRSAAPARTTSVSANVRQNNTAGDPAGSTQSENAFTADGANMIAGWNDGKNFSVSPGGTGYGYSTNGGLSWTDGGVLPVPSATALHEGDPCLTNDFANNWYFSDLYTPDNHVTSAVAVTKGSFAGPVLTWGMPVMVASSVSDFLDKEWIAADKITGNVYCTYTRFLAAGGNQIEFSRSTTGGASWDPPVALTSPVVESCQGSRVVVGPTGEIQVIYFVYDKASGNNYMRTRRSTTNGLSFGPEITLPTGPSGIISGYGSGPAGFNRAGGIGFPSMAIDRTGGANSGHVYATWEETVNFYYDPLGGGGSIVETEANDTPGTANPVIIGQQVHGVMSSTADQDWYSITGVAGQTVIIYLVPEGPTPGDGFLRLFCGGGAAANRAQLSYIGFGTGLCVYTFPSNGTYYFRVLANTASIGNYVVYTGLDAPDPGDEVGRDTRDVIVQSSPDGTVWDSRRVVNDSPPRFDDAFPEVAVDAAGQVYIDWMDHRGDPCGIGTDMYYARSSNASVSFLPSIKVNDGPPVNWSLVSSNLAPNMGDYLSLVADGCNVYASFADGRQGTPDCWMAVINDCATPTLISLAPYVAMPDHVDLTWIASDGAGLVAGVERRETGGDWASLGTIRPDGTGRMTFRDASVRAGATYDYRLAINSQTGLEYFGGLTVEVPQDLSFSVRGLGNPLKGSMDFAFKLPGSDAGMIELLDVAGRVVDAKKVSGQGTARLGAGTARGGIYFVRLTAKSGRSMTNKVVFFE
jgi:hypothetical protein